MVAVPVSPHNCPSCQHAYATLLDRHVCSACGTPQPVARGEDYFSAFGAERRFGQDRALLEKRFYEISRALHPDRFTTASPSAQILSLERMSFLNQAYRTLRDPAALREYILQLEGVKTPVRGAQSGPGAASGAGARIPVELAESWFELQDLLVDSPNEARGRLTEFEDELRSLSERAAAALTETERAIDAAGGPERARELLERLERELQSQGYLRSMERDVERIRTRIA